MLVIKSHKDLDTRQSLRAIDPFCIDQTDTKAMQAQIKPGATIPPLERGCRGIEPSQCIKAPFRGFGGYAEALTASSQILESQTFFHLQNLN